MRILHAVHETWYRNLWADLSVYLFTDIQFIKPSVSCLSRWCFLLLCIASSAVALQHGECPLCHWRLTRKNEALQEMFPSGLVDAVAGFWSAFLWLVLYVCLWAHASTTCLHLRQGHTFLRLELGKHTRKEPLCKTRNTKKKREALSIRAVKFTDKSLQL